MELLTIISLLALQIILFLFLVLRAKLAYTRFLGMLESRFKALAEEQQKVEAELLRLENRIDTCGRELARLKTDALLDFISAQAERPEIRKQLPEGGAEAWDRIFRQLRVENLQQRPLK